MRKKSKKMITKYLLISKVVQTYFIGYYYPEFLQQGTMLTRPIFKADSVGGSKW